MLKLDLLLYLVVSIAYPLAQAVSSQSYTWKNVKIGGGGGFVPGIIFNPTEKGLAYARTDIGGAYKLNSDDTWTPLLDFVDDARWNYWGVDALATDPVEPNRLYLVTGMYTNSWDPNNGQILISTDYGTTFEVSKLSFKVGGNMPGRGILAVDPHKNSILFFGARSGNGLWKSTDYGVSWARSPASPTLVGSYVADSSDTTGYNSDKIGIAWVTFDGTSGTSGQATPRIFVGVANKGSTNIYSTNDGGSTWSAVAGQNTTYLPHKGVLSPSEKALYVSYSDGAGPYDGTAGSVYKYNISSGVWTDITPVSGGDLYFGFGGVAVDLQTPGTIMVAALNSCGATWSPFWAWGNYPEMLKYYTYSDSLAPWLGPNYVDTTAGDKQIGWMMEALVIDPHDSNHWLYGTGATIQGGHDLLKWDTVHNVTLKSLADGIEETAIQGLISPPTGPSLLSAVGDIGGFVHNSLTSAPSTMFTNPTWATASDIDFAGNKPTNIVRIGTGDSSTGKQVALSSDSGVTWSQDYGAADNVSGGKVAISADADTVLWRTGSNGVLVSQFTNAFVAVTTLPSDAVIASDKKNNSIFYGASSSAFYLSIDSGKTFSKKTTLGNSTAPVKIVVNPALTGDVWVSTDKGLFHSTDLGTSFTAISAVSQAWAIALGASASTGGYPALYAAANIGGVGYFRSDDSGLNWVKINDVAHGFGSVSANVLTADPRIYGRVYIGTNGRGIFYGDANGAAPSSTVTTSTATSSTTKSSSTLSSTSSTTATTSSATSSTTKTSSTFSSTSASSTSTRATSVTSTSSSAAPTATAGAYGQGWAGPTTCSTGYTCTSYNTCKSVSPRQIALANVP
ncbi:hypothetical protein BDQ17DRAFT_1386098 [Cyathus striatus]|nr:hypothetical protein BDQ17DRAFT_1386098 [Cyathus striatus]